MNVVIFGDNMLLMLYSCIMFTHPRACNMSAALPGVQFHDPLFFIFQRVFSPEIWKCRQRAERFKSIAHAPLPTPHRNKYYINVYILAISDIDALPFHRVVIHDLRCQSTAGP